MFGWHGKDLGSISNTEKQTNKTPVLNLFIRHWAPLRIRNLYSNMRTSCDKNYLFVDHRQNGIDHFLSGLVWVGLKNKAVLKKRNVSSSLGTQWWM